MQYKKDRTLLTQLIKQYGEPQLKAAIDLFFRLRKDGDSFFSQTGMTVGVFYSSINRLNNILAPKEVNKDSANHQTDTATFLARIRANRTIQYRRPPAVGNINPAELGKQPSGTNAVCPGNKKMVL
ncbi:MAG: hypothetical protein QME64_10075 [bacterium]|nr:hypothetical protein [bacterium]